ncbi:MAG TPA: class I SAM-dependent methyltransferase [Polyangiaceae bacterium]
MRALVRRGLDRLDRNATVRDAAVARWAATLAPGSVVLDVGAGTLRYRSLFAHCRYIAQDHPDVDYAGEGVELVRSDITAIPLEKGSVDAILCTEVLEHVEQPLVAIDEFARLLRPGGRLFLSVPAACRVHRVPTHYYGGYAPDFFERSIPARGFELNALDPVGNWSEFMAQELGRVPEMIREHTSLPAVARRILGAAAWPVFRVGVPLVLLRLAKIDTSTDLPLGWIGYATRLPTA